MGLPNLIRREQTLRELERVETAIKSWLALRNDRDKDEHGRYVGLHKTRLDTLQGILTQALITLRAELMKIDVRPERTREEVYEDCRAFDRALVWMERVWLYYREKFDQRDDQNWALLLKAADELVWSCYRQIYVNKSLLPGELKIGPAPLSYIDTEYSPATWERDKLAPAELRREREIGNLQTFLDTLPITVLRLPPWCIAAPWWLVFVAHEVGHTIQRELGLVKQMEDRFARVCVEHGYTAKEVEDWKHWSKEIFADLFSVMLMGPPAIRGVLEIVLAPRTAMLTPQGEYPPPIVRLQLMARAADCKNLNGNSGLAGLNPGQMAQGAESVERNLKLVNAIVAAVLDEPLGPGIGKLEELCGLKNPAEDEFLKGVQNWSQQLQKAQPARPSPHLQTPRFLVSGAVNAWQVVSESTPEPRLALELLAKNTIDLLMVSGPAGVRGESPRPPDVAGYGNGLANQLLKLSRQELEPTSRTR